LRKTNAEFARDTQTRTSASYGVPRQALLKNETTAYLGIKNIRLNAGCDEEYIATILFGK
jgi:hypothetical protein